MPAHRNYFVENVIHASLFPLMAGLIAVLSFLGTAAAEGKNLRAPLTPPATPLIACDPYFSIWSPADRLTEADTIHWTGKPHRLTSLVTIDGKPFRMMGREPTRVPALEQTALDVEPTQTRYRFAQDGVELTLTFSTPALPDDIDLLSRPITYVTCSAQSTDGKQHDVRWYFEASAELTVNAPEQAVVATVEHPEGAVALKIGSKSQSILGRHGDDVRIDWGHLYLAASPELQPELSLGAPEELRSRFCEGKEQQDSNTSNSPRADQLSAQLSFDLSTVESKPVTRWLVVAYDDIYSIEYMQNRLRPYWRRNGLDAHGLIAESVRDYESNIDRCTAFDHELVADLNQCGGANYAAIGSAAYRQCFAAGKFVADAHGQPLQFSKENHSNGCIATSDVFYPMSPQFLLFGPSLAKSFLVPFMNYAASERWKFPFAPHDLGTYPKANGQVYGGGERSEQDQMPVEESGNVLLLMAAIAKLEGNTTFVDRYWPQLEAWARYLKKEGYDPANQLCTDDFAGHLAHNTNLSAKAICALGAYAQMCETRGDLQQAAEYRRIVEDFATRWVKEADDGTHYRLTFDRPGTWSQKYNLVWDRLLGLKLFPSEVVRKEMDFYRTKQAQYGLPLDNRDNYTKLDWILWTATLTGDRNDFETLINPVYSFINSAPDRLPLTDWYRTDSGRKVGFTARPVIGGVFLKMLYEDELWKKWASRDRTKAADFAPLPSPPRTLAIVPTAETASLAWRYVGDEPPGDWIARNYDDSTWREGRSGFGSQGTPGTAIGEPWTSSQIWLRRDFDVDTNTASKLQLRIYHDEDAKVYINGVLAAECIGFSGQYVTIPVADEARATLSSTGNTLAIYCRQTTGGQYIDAGLVVVDSETN